MANLKLCVPLFFPDFTSLHESVKSLLQIPSFDFPFDIPRPLFNFPALPTLPLPIYTGFQSFENELAHFISELQNFQLMTLINRVLKPIFKVLSLGFDVLPEIPYLDISFPELLVIDMQKLVDKVKTFSKEKFKELLAFLGLPSPLYISISNIEAEINHAIQILVRDYLTTIVNLIPNFINQVIEFLDILGIDFSLPEIPNFSTFYNSFAIPAIKKALGIPDDMSISKFIAEEMRKVVDAVGDTVEGIKDKIKDAIAGISIPGFNFSKLIPKPFYFHLSKIEYEILEYVKNIYTNLVVSPIKIIFDFIRKKLHLSISLPSICIPLTIPDNIALNVTAIAAAKEAAESVSTSINNLKSLPKTVEGTSVTINKSLSLEIPGADKTQVFLNNVGEPLRLYTSTNTDIIFTANISNALYS